MSGSKIRAVTLYYKEKLQVCLHLLCSNRNVSRNKISCMENRHKHEAKENENIWSVSCFTGQVVKSVLSVHYIALLYFLIWEYL